MNRKTLPKAITPSFSPAATPSPAVPEPVTHLRHEPLRPAPAQTDTGAAADESRRDIATRVVERFCVWSGAASFIPVPLLDLAVIGGMQLEMLRRVSHIYDVPFSKNMGKALLASLAGSMIPASSGAGVMSLLKGVPLAGTAVSFFALPALSTGAGYAIGMAFIEHFESGGTLLDFDPARYRHFRQSAKNSPA